jgi:hypothetical protein
MPARRKFSDETIEAMLSAFHSDKSGEETARMFGTSYFPTLRRIWMDFYGNDALKERHSRLARLGKIGAKNPMRGKFGARHHNYSEHKVSPQGYKLVQCPRWYLGPRNKGILVHEHLVVACEKYRIRRLPPHHIVHHKDENKLNNHPDNLEIMSRGKHAVTHRWLDHYRKVQRLSRKGVHSKQSGKA